jgi:hypothetical protein
MSRSQILLSVCPRSVITDNRDALVAADARRRRAIAIVTAGHECENCGWLAWSNKRAAQFEIREDVETPESPLVLCSACATTHDSANEKRKQRKLKRKLAVAGQ